MEAFDAFERIVEHLWGHQPGHMCNYARNTYLWKEVEGENSIVLIHVGSVLRLKVILEGRRVHIMAIREPSEWPYSNYYWHHGVLNDTDLAKIKLLFPFTDYPPCEVAI